MEIFLSVWFWLGVGAFLVLSELIIPGGIVVFLGLGAWIVAGGIALGLVESWVNALTLYFVSSLALVILLRGLAQRYVGGDSSIANTDERVDAYGQLVDVVAEIGPGDKPGRVRFQGTEWRALGNGQLIAAGEKARIVSMENITLIVDAMTRESTAQ